VDSRVSVTVEAAKLLARGEVVEVDAPVLAGCHGEILVVG
jgi:hypothetical protein